MVEHGRRGRSIGLARLLVLATALCLAACGSSTGAAPDPGASQRFDSVEAVVAAIRAAGVACEPGPMAGEPGPDGSPGPDVSGAEAMAKFGQANCQDPDGRSFDVTSIFDPRTSIEGVDPGDAAALRAKLSTQTFEEGFRASEYGSFKYVADALTDRDYGYCLLLGPNWSIRVMYHTGIDASAQGDGRLLKQLDDALKPFLECRGSSAPYLPT